MTDPTEGAGAPRRGLTPGVSAAILAGGVIVVLLETASLLVVPGLLLIALGAYGLLRRPRVALRPAVETAGAAPLAGDSADH